MLLLTYLLSLLPSCADIRCAFLGLRTGDLWAYELRGLVGGYSTGSRLAWERTNSYVFLSIFSLVEYIKTNPMFQVIPSPAQYHQESGPFTAVFGVLSESLARQVTSSWLDVKKRSGRRRWRTAYYGFCLQLSAGFHRGKKIRSRPVTRSLHLAGMGFMSL